MIRRDFFTLFAAAALTPLTGFAVDDYRSNFVEAHGVANRGEVEREIDAIIFRLCERYGTPQTWNKFPVVFVGANGIYAGCTYYQKPSVVRIEICQSFATAKGGTLDHELTHAFFFYLLNNYFPLFWNEGAAENSEYRQRERLRSTVYRRAGDGEFVALDRLVNRTGYDGALLIYHQGFSVVDFLIARGGSKWFSAFLSDLTNGGLELNDALQKYYGYDDLEALERDWIGYVGDGQDRSTVKPLF